MSFVPLFFAAVCLMLLAPPATAQWDDDDEDEWEEEERRGDKDGWDDDEGEFEQQAPSEGDWALMFQVRSPILNLHLSSFQGGVISGKYHYSETSALRFGVRLSGRSTDDESQEEREVISEPPAGFDQSFKEENTFDENSILVGLESQYVSYPLLDDDLGMYFGAGPSISIQLYSSDRRDAAIDTTDNPDDTDRFRTFSRETDGTTLSFGARGVVGGEWLFHEAMSLSAEYGLLLDYFITNEEQRIEDVDRIVFPDGEVVEQTNRQTIETDRSGWRLDGTGVKLGFTFYF